MIKTKTETGYDLVPRTSCCTRGVLLSALIMRGLSSGAWCSGTTGAASLSPVAMPASASASICRVRCTNLTRPGSSGYQSTRTLIVEVQEIFEENKAQRK
jgi:hypothetical protein